MARISYSPPQLPISVSRAYTCALLHHGIRHSLSLSKMANSFLRSSPIVSSGHQYVGVRSSSSDYLGFLKSLSFSRIKSSGITRPLQTKRISPVVRATEGENNPGGFHKYRHLWVQCDVCYGLNYKPLFNSKNYICESCGYHVEMSSSDRIDLLIDPGTWVPMDEDMVSTDPLKWDFEEKEEPFQLDLSEWESEFKKVYAELEKRIQLKKEKEKADQEHLNSAAKEKISSEKKEKTDED